MPQTGKGQAQAGKSKGFFGGWLSSGSSSADAETRLEEGAVAETSLGSQVTHFVPKATRNTLASFRANPTFDGATLKSQQSLEDTRQKEIDASLQGFFGGYLIRSLNFVHRNLVRTRLAFRSGSFEENYYRYCYQQRSESYKQTLLDCDYRIKTEDEFGKWAHSRHLLASMLPANLPMDTKDESVNKANAQANQANWLLEQRIRKLIRKELTALKSKNQDPRDADIYDQLLSQVLFAIQDPDVKWILVIDAAIAAGLLLEEEIILLETYGPQSDYTKGLDTTVDMTDHPAEKSTGFILSALPAYRPQADGAVTVVLPTQEGYYLAPTSLSAEDAAKYGYTAGKSSDDQRTYDQGAALEEEEEKKGGYDNTGEHAADLSDDEQPQYDAGAAYEKDEEDQDAAAYAIADDHREVVTVFARKDVAAISLASGLENGVADDELPDYTLATGSINVPAYSKEKLSAKFVKRSPPRERTERADSHGSGSSGDHSGSDDSHYYSQASDGTGKSANSEGYLDVSPEGEGDDDEVRPYAMSQQKVHQRLPSDSPLKHEQKRPRADLPRAPMPQPRSSWMEQSAEAPILPNPFKKLGQDDSKLLHDTLYDSLVRAIRKVLRGESEFTLADLVRDQVRRLIDDSQSAPQLKAIQIVARLANREMATPGFNYLAGLEVSDDQYQKLFSALSETVDAYRYYFAAPEGSVPEKPKERVLHDNMENIRPFISEFINLYLNQLRISLETKTPFQFAIVIRPNVVGKEAKKNIFLIIKQGKKEGGCEKACYELKIDAETERAKFVRSKKSFVSYHELDLHKPNAKPAESFGDDPGYYGYRDEEDNHFEVVTASNVELDDPYLLPRDREQRVKQLKVVLPAELLSTISSSAIQYAYNKQDSYSGLTNARRWLQSHPKTVAVVGVGVFAGAAAGAAYGAGLFNSSTAPCQGYVNGQGACIDGNIPNPQCSLVTDTTTVLAGGTVRITPTCSNLAAFQASSSQFIIDNLPSGSQLSVNNHIIVSNFNGTQFDATLYIGQQISIKLPTRESGFYGSWVPTGSVRFVSASKTFTGSVSSPQPVYVQPIPGTATVTLSQGTFNINQNTNTTFTLSCAPAQGDSSINLYISNLAMGDTLVWRATNGTMLQFTATLANNGTGMLSGVGFNQQFTYVPARNTWGIKSFSLYAKSVAGGVEATTSSISLDLNYRIQGIASPVISINAPTVVNSVQGQYSAPFNLTATPASQNTLVQQVVLPPGASLCDVASNNCLTNNGAQPQTFTIPSSWGTEVKYRSNANGDAFVYQCQDSLDGTMSALSSVNVGVNQLAQPVLNFAAVNGTRISQYNGIEDTPAQFYANVTLGNAVRADVELQLPALTGAYQGAFAGGLYQINGTLSNGFNVSVSAAPGSSVNISNWNLAQPISVTPPLNVNSGNQGQNLNLGLQVTSYATDGRAVTVSQNLPVYVAPVADDFTFDFNPKTFNVGQGASRSFAGSLQTNVPGEVVSNFVRFVNLPNSTSVIRYDPPGDINRYQQSIALGNNSFDVPTSTFTSIVLYSVPGNAPAPQASNATAMASVNDYGSILTKYVEGFFQVKAPSRRRTIDEKEDVLTNRQKLTN